MNNKFDEPSKAVAESVTRRAALRKLSFGLLGMALACFGLANRAHAAGPTFTTIDYPNAAATLAVDINVNGQIVGRFVDGSGTHGWLLSAGNFTRIDLPGASATRPRGINLTGDIVGHYVSQGEQEHGFLLRGGVFTTFDYPGAVETAPAAYSHAGGLNSFGDIVNTYASGTPYGNLANPNVYGNVHGLLMSRGVFTPIDPPGGGETVACGINDSRQVVGV